MTNLDLATARFDFEAWEVRPYGYYDDPRWERSNNEKGALPHCLSAGLLLSKDGKRYGGCVRVSENFILTAHHVIDIPDMARRFKVRFNFVTKDLKDAFEYELDPDQGFFCSDDGIQGPEGYEFDLDYVLIGLAGPFPLDDPSRKNIPRVNRGSPVRGSRAYIPQHTDRGPMQFAQERLDVYRLGGLVIEYDDSYLFHHTSTKGGTSGSPIFDEHWQLIGLHTHGYRSQLGKDPLRSNYNWGTRVTKIIGDARARFKNLPRIAAFEESPDPGRPSNAGGRYATE